MILQSVFAFVIVVGILVCFHELGHFLTAKYFGVKVLRFSVGFGKPIFIKRYGRDETEFVIGAFPLGGYVKMLDETEGDVPDKDLPYAFNRQSLAKRFAIVLAGPLFNFIFAVLMYFILFLVGIDGLRPIIGDVRQGSVLESAGLQSGDTVLAVNDREVQTWSVFLQSLLHVAVNKQAATLSIVEDQGVRRDIYLNFDDMLDLDEIANGALLEQLGITPAKIELPSVIGKVIPDSPAHISGLREYDHILRVNDEPIRFWHEWVTLVQQHPQKLLYLEIMRDDQILNLEMIPRGIESDQGLIGQAGVGVQRDNLTTYFAKEHYPPLQALAKAFIKACDMSVLTLQVIGRMLQGELSVKHLNGPVYIAYYAGQSMEFGWIDFIGFMALVSISLCIFNLLPIPLLDGGHLFYYLLEFITGKPSSQLMQRQAQYIGIAFLGLLTIVVFYNDISRLLG